MTRSLYMCISSCRVLPGRCVQVRNPWCTIFRKFWLVQVQNAWCSDFWKFWLSITFLQNLCWILLTRTRWSMHCTSNSSSVFLAATSHTIPQVSMRFLSCRVCVGQCTAHCLLRALCLWRDAALLSRCVCNETSYTVFAQSCSASCEGFRSLSVLFTLAWDLLALWQEEGVFNESLALRSLAPIGLHICLVHDLFMMWYTYTGMGKGATEATTMGLVYVTPLLIYLCVQVSGASHDCWIVSSILL